MDRMSEAAAGGSGRRRMSGDAAVTTDGAEGVDLSSIAASATGARAGGRPRGAPLATAVRSARPARSAAASSYSERLRKRYAEDAEYRNGVQARNRAYRAAHRDELNARARKAYAENDEYRARRRLSGNKWYRRQERLKQVYGLSLQDYNAMVAQQGGVCRVCKTKPARPLFVDHCHASGRVRGLLCHPCNAALGFMRDDPVIAAAAADYLRDAKREGGPA
jgi:hypothetical protein